MFYEYEQNNTGGSFYGPEYVIIEANSSKEADSLGESKAGLYFDGVGDCECCGNRWYKFCGTGSEEPEIYKETDKSKWTSTFGGVCKIYYLNGQIEEVTLNSLIGNGDLL